MKPISYGKQFISDEDINAVVEVLRSDFLTQGPKVAEFEKEFAKYVDAKYAIAVSNGTTALHLCALALNIQPGDKVITTPLTFVASANCIRYCGGVVDFVDIDPETYLLDLDKLEQKLASSPVGTYKGIIPVDFAGYPTNVEKLREIANKYGLWIIQDSCHSSGGYFTDSKGIQQKCGNGVYADLQVFSFHPVKHIATGEGGMITTNNKELYDKICLLRTHGITKAPELLIENHGGWYYEMQELGYNYRLSDIQAALGTSQLARASNGLAKRREIAQMYYDEFKNIPQIKGQSGVIEGHAYHLYVILGENRKGLYDHLHANNIYAQIHYAPIHLMPYYRKFGWENGDLPNVEKYYSQCISLPMYPTLTEDEQQFVIDTIINFYSSK